MGGKYDSIHFKTPSRDAVVNAANELSKKHSLRMFVGPELNGWVGVYPKWSPRQPDIASQLATAINGYAIHLNVYDDDVLTYRFFHNGALLDSFNSSPDYFGRNSEERKKIGRPEVFVPLVGETKLPLLQELVRQTLEDDIVDPDEEVEPDFAFEYERLEKLAEALGIKNAVSSFEYLLDGETDFTEGWDQFIEVPQK